MQSLGGWLIGWRKVMLIQVGHTPVLFNMDLVSWLPDHLMLFYFDIYGLNFRSGVYDALQKKYLKTLLFCICEETEGSMIEEYACEDQFYLCIFSSHLIRCSFMLTIELRLHGCDST